MYARALLTVERIPVADSAAETARVSASAVCVRDDLLRVVERLKRTEAPGADILLAQLEFLDDPAYYGEIVNTVATEHINAEAAVESVRDALMKEFRELENEYFRERASDIQDMSARLIADLSGTPLRSLADIDKEVILVAEELLPSDTAQLNPDHVIAFCTERGTATSHTALLANSLGIPAVVGCGEITAKNDEMLIVNGSDGLVHIQPSEKEIAAAQAQIVVDTAKEQARIDSARRPATTRDGIPCRVYANIASATEAEKALGYGAEGSGLLRTEFFFYQEDDLPTEERQFNMYAEIARIIGAKPITVRTLDIGGDKPLKALQGSYADESNPFLGVRGVRLTATVPDLLASQLRALIRVATECSGQIKIMLPFVSTIEEVKPWRETVEALCQQLDQERRVTHTRPKVGAMIEIPSAALMMDSMVKYIDFASIGTNDLAQYTCAADRTNEQVSDLADYCHPAVLKMIKMILDSGQRNGKEVSICGEMAGDPIVIPLLYGMGLSVYSMSAVRIPHAKEILSKVRRAECAVLCQQCLQAETASEVRGYLNDFSLS